MGRSPGKQAEKESCAWESAGGEGLGREGGDTSREGQASLGMTGSKKPVCIPV